jgi:hypothetical protein
MPSPFTPVPRTWRILETDSYRQLALPLAQREFKSGDAMWLNKYTSSNNIQSWIESALNNCSTYSTAALVTSASSATTYSSSSATAQAAQRAFAALFMGILLDHRTPRSFNKYLNFATSAVAGSVQYDSSAPFGTVITAGIADVPYYDGTNSAVPAGYGYPVDYGFTLSAFQNNATGFTDASGIAQTVEGASGPAWGYYLYNNSVTPTTDAASIICRLVRAAKAGDSVLRVAFSSFMSVPVSGQVAGLAV